MDFIFGSFREWMGVLGHRTGSKHCTLTRTEWEDSLRVTGYSDTLFLASSSNILAHIAFVCQSNRIPTASHGSSPLSPTPALSAGSDSPHTNSVPVTPSDTDNDTPIDGSSGIEFNKMLTEKGPMDNDHFKLPFSAAPVRVHSPMLCSATDTITVRRFVAGDEVQLVSFLSDIDATKHHTFWLYTDTQVCNATLLGLIRSIRHEFSMWKFYAVLFDPSWDPSRQESYIYEQFIPLDWVDAEVLVDKDGNIYVPRIVKAPSPSRTEMRGSNPIQFNGSDIWRAYPAELGPDDVEVTVVFISLSPVFPGCSEFSGYISSVGENIVNDDVISE
jgi:fatty acid synthase